MNHDLLQRSNIDRGASKSKLAGSEIVLATRGCSSLSALPEFVQLRGEGNGVISEGGRPSKNQEKLHLHRADMRKYKVCHTARLVVLHLNEYDGSSILS